MAKRRTSKASNKKPKGKGPAARRGLRFEGANPALSPRFLSAAEHLLTPFRLPAEFRDFLLKQNGGTPDPRLFTWSHPEAGEQEAAVDNLFGIDARPLDDPSRSVDCISLALQMRDDLPRYCLPIGFADRDDILLLFTHGPREGQVWIKRWDEVNPMYGSETSAEEAVYFVADSFNRFLALLTSEQDPYFPVYIALDGPTVRGKRLAAKLEALGGKRFLYVGVTSQTALPPMWEWPKYRRGGAKGPATLSVQKNLTYGHAAKVADRKKGHPILAVDAAADDRNACLADLTAALGKEAVRL